MKKITLLFVSVVTISTMSFAQVKFGFKAGIQSTSFRIHVEEGDTKATVDGTRAGFLLGGTAEIGLSEHFAFQPNLLFFMKNGYVSLGSSKSNIFTIDIPLNFVYTEGGFFVGAGPNFSYGISGKLKPFDGGDPDEDAYKGEGGADPLLKRFEFGINALMGYKFSGGFTISSNFTPGLTDILNTDEEGTTVHNNAFGISFGYTFGGKAKAKK